MPESAAAGAVPARDRASPGWVSLAWPGAGVRAGFTTRLGGCSVGAWGDAGGEAGLNLGAHCGDDPQAVAANRERLRGLMPGSPNWLEQVHGTEVVVLDDPCDSPPRADAAVTDRPGVVLAILSADCLPVLLADDEGRVVGAAHAGWRGLAAGVLENMLAAARALSPHSRRWHAWLGPAIGQSAFEVGEEVRAAFLHGDRQAATCFLEGGRPGKWHADLAGLARRRLLRAGLDRIIEEQACTHRDAERFYSYRRDGLTGRFGSFIWRDPRA
jgi:YfiH family protein